MEKKYDPNNILVGIWAESLFKDEVHNYEIFIEIKESNNQCYRIIAEEKKSAQLLEGACSGSNWRKRKREILFENKDLLGKVYVWHKRKEEINGKPKLIYRKIKSFESYNEFWNKIKRG